MLIMLIYIKSVQSLWTLNIVCTVSLFSVFLHTKSLIKISLNHERNYRSKKNVCGNPQVGKQPDNQVQQRDATAETVYRNGHRPSHGQGWQDSLQGLQQSGEHLA